MKKTLFLVLIIILTFIIYDKTKDEKIYYLALGDEVSTQEIISDVSNYYKRINNYEKKVEYINYNYRTTDLINDILENVYIDDNITLKNSLIKADVITISIGFNDIKNYLDDAALLDLNILELKKDMEELLKTLRSISKEKIILIGIYNPFPENIELEKVLKKLNYLYSKLANEYNIYYLDIYDDLTDKMFDDKKINYNGFRIISNKLIKILENDIIE